MTRGKRKRLRKAVVKASRSMGLGVQVTVGAVGEGVFKKFREITERAEASGQLLDVSSSRDYLLE